MFLNIIFHSGSFYDKYVLPVFIVCYGIAKCIREITRVSVMCLYLTVNDLIYDQVNTLYNNFAIQIPNVVY